MMVGPAEEETEELSKQIGVLNNQSSMANTKIPRPALSESARAVRLVRPGAFHVKTNAVLLASVPEKRLLLSFLPVAPKPCQNSYISKASTASGHSPPDTLRLQYPKGSAEPSCSGVCLAIHIWTSGMFILSPRGAA